MLLMFVLDFGIDQNVVNKDDDEIIKEGLKHSVHEVHKCCWCIGKPKGHHKKFLMPIPSTNGSLRNVFPFDLQLVVPRFEVNLGEALGTHQLVK